MVGVLGPSTNLIPLLEKGDQIMLMLLHNLGKMTTWVCHVCGMRGHEIMREVWTRCIV